jgi:DNA-binding LytR/AlgR family response regulator
MIRPLKAVIADDEYLICETLEEILDDLQVEVLAVCHDGLDALKVIGEHDPDVVFLDIRMPSLSGIEVAAKLTGTKAPLVVFITAYDDYALKAYEVNALDYLLKPFVQDDVKRVIDKINRLSTKGMTLSAKADGKHKEEAGEYPLQFCFYRANRTVIVPADEIMCAYAENRGVFVQTIGGEVYTVKSGLADLEEKLDPKYFFRCHRNYLVNMRHAKELAPGFNRGYLLTLRGAAKTEVPVSRAKISQLSRYVHF